MRHGGLLMKVEKVRRLALLGAAIFATFAAKGAPANTNSNRQDFSGFKVISDRNIFNPRRYARSSERPAPTNRPARVDSITLAGTMSYEKGSFAFFDSASSQYRKTAQTNDTIAGFKVSAIMQDHVVLKGETNEITVPVGMQLRREDRGAWHVQKAPEAPVVASIPSSAPPAPAPTSTAPPPSAPPPNIVVMPSPEGDEMRIELPPEFSGGGEPLTNGAPSAAAPSASSGAESDVLRRLMQRREQELNR